VNAFLSGLVENTLFALEDAQCIAINDDDTLETLPMGRIAAFYYLQYTTAALFSSSLQADMDLEQVRFCRCRFPLPVTSDTGG
jgi:activating signal cointegrator complex subunit 3